MVDLSTSGLKVGGLFWTNFHQPGSPNSCAPERKKVGLPTDRQPATVLHHVDVFFLHRDRHQGQGYGAGSCPWTALEQPFIS